MFRWMVVLLPTHQWRLGPGVNFLDVLEVLYDSETQKKIQISFIPYFFEYKLMRTRVQYQNRVKSNAVEIWGTHFKILFIKDRWGNCINVISVAHKHAITNQTRGASLEHPCWPTFTISGPVGFDLCNHLKTFWWTNRRSFGNCVLMEWWNVPMNGNFPWIFE